MIIDIELESTADWYSFQDLDLRDTAVLAAFVSRSHTMPIAEAQNWIVPRLVRVMGEIFDTPHSVAVFARTFLNSPVNRLQKLKIEKFNFTEEIAGSFIREGASDDSGGRESIGGVFSKSWESRVAREDLSGEEIFFWGELREAGSEQVLKFLISSSRSIGSSSVCILGGAGLSKKVLDSRHSAQSGVSGSGELVRRLLRAGLHGQIIIYPVGEFDDREIGFNILGNKEVLTAIGQGLLSSNGR